MPNPRREQVLPLPPEMLMQLFGGGGPPEQQPTFNPALLDPNSQEGQFFALDIAQRGQGGGSWAAEKYGIPPDVLRQKFPRSFPASAGLDQHMISPVSQPAQQQSSSFDPFNTLNQALRQPNKATSN